MENSNKLFTVIIPCYKNSELLPSCIESVLRQTYPRIELIICEDHGGQFDISEFVNYVESKKNGNLERYEIYSNPENYGTVKSLNCALKKASGDYIKIIAADDVLADSSVLETVSRDISNDEHSCFMYDVMLCDYDLNEKELAKSDFLEDLDSLSPAECFKRLCVRNRINATGVFFKKSFFDKNGLFDEKYKLLEDWPTWLNLYARNDFIPYRRFTAAKRRVSTGVVANNNPYYLADRRLVWKDIIKPKKKAIGTKLYIKSFVSSYLLTVPFLRKIYFKFKKV